jgi:hypothetical protein
MTTSSLSLTSATATRMTIKAAAKRKTTTRPRRQPACPSSTHASSLSVRTARRAAAAANIGKDWTIRWPAASRPGASGQPGLWARFLAAAVPASAANGDHRR